MIPDQDGVITPSIDGSVGSIPGKLQFLTRNDDGNLFVKGEFDKAGRFITYMQHWTVTSAPTGSPLVCLANNDENSKGAKLSLRRSRGTFENPESVNLKDNVFRISWEAHDGISYKEVATISVDVTEQVDPYKVPTTIVFKTTDSNGELKNSAEIPEPGMLKIDRISSLTGNSISLGNPVQLASYANETERDIKIINPKKGMMIFLDNCEIVQVYTEKAGWINLT